MEIQNISYYLLGASWENEDQTQRFVENGIWENGYKDKFLDLVKSIAVGDKVAIKSSFTKERKISMLRIKAIGTVVENLQDGITLKIKWDSHLPHFDLEGYGSYRQTVQRVATEHIQGIFYHFSKTSHNQHKPAESNMPLNQILFGPPGTGKTYNSISEAVKIAAPERHSDDHKNNKIVFDQLRKDGQIEFVTFHQNYAYEDFMVGIRPNVSDETDNLSFKKHTGIFYEIAKRARENYENSLHNFDFDRIFAQFIQPINNGQFIKLKMAGGKDMTLTSLSVSDSSIEFEKPDGKSEHNLSIKTIKEIIENNKETPVGLVSYYNPVVQELKKRMELKNYVLIIDEINRANISKVFGELITLLEDDKRLGAENELRISLPNGEGDFAVPPNLYLIGTMNTADKSIALIDIALRRRFEFVGFYPKYDKLTQEASELLQKINEEIYKRKNSADYLIGHAYFMKKDQDIKTVLKNKVVPLLMEYFAGKTKSVEEIFNDTSWEVKYNTATFNWEIDKSSK